MERHTSWESQAGGLTDLLWQHKNLDQEDAEKDEAGTGHVVLERWQCSGSVLGRKRAPWDVVDGCCTQQPRCIWDSERLVNCRCQQKQAMAAISGSQRPPSRWTWVAYTGCSVWVHVLETHLYLRESSQEGRKHPSRAQWVLPVPCSPTPGLCGGKGMAFQVVTLLNGTKKMADIGNACISTSHFIEYLSAT